MLVNRAKLPLVGFMAEVKYKLTTTKAVNMFANTHVRAIPNFLNAIGDNLYVDCK